MKLTDREKMIGEVYFRAAFEGAQKNSQFEGAQKNSESENLIISLEDYLNIYHKIIEDWREESFEKWMMNDEKELPVKDEIGTVVKNDSKATFPVRMLVGREDHEKISHENVH